MIVLGIILLIVGFLSKVAIGWTLGIIALLVGVVRAIAGGGRSMADAPGGERPTASWADRCGAGNSPADRRRIC